MVSYIEGVSVERG